MMSGKERASLRAEAHHLSVKVHIGLNGLTPGAMATVDDVLRTHELVKLQTAKGSELSAREASTQIASVLKAEVVQTIGRTFTLYRRNDKLVRGETPPWR